MNQEAKVVLPENLNHYIADYLRRKIFCGDSYRKGDQIVERDIAEELNVSRSPVREALKELEHQGIVVAKPRVGWFVAKHTEKELREIMEVRTMLELRMFEDLITGDRLNKEDFALLDGHMKKEKRMIAEKDSWLRTVGFADLDMEFHMFLLEKTDFSLIKNILRSLYYQIRLSLLNNMCSDDQVELFHRRHVIILDGLKNKDFSEIEKVLSIRRQWYK